MILEKFNIKHDKYYDELKKKKFLIKELKEFNWWKNKRKIKVEFNDRYNLEKYKFEDLFPIKFIMKYFRERLYYLNNNNWLLKYNINRKKFYYYKLITFKWKPYLKILFFSLIKNGKKKKLLGYFFKFFYFIKLKNITTSITSYLHQVFYRLKPLLFYKYYHKNKRSRYILPWKYYSNFLQKKYIKLVVTWIKKSLKKRNEKTFILKIYSEFEKIRKNTGYTIMQKRYFYYNFYRSKSFFNFIKFIKSKC